MAKKKIDIPGIDIVDAALKKMGIDIRDDIVFLDPQYFVSTGSIALDNILGEGRGFAPGIVELYGPEGVGKTTLSLGILAEAQQLGLTTYFFDVEKKLTSSMIRTIDGLDATKTRWPVVNHGNDVISALDVILPQSPKSVIVIDSIPAMISAAQFKEASDKDFYAQIPKLLTNFLPKARTWVREHQSLLILLNQERDVINSYGNAPRKRTPGGNALKYYADIRVHLRTIERIKEKEEVVGQKIRAETKKNCYARPYQSVVLSLIYGSGIDKVRELIDLGLEFGIIEKGGAWFNYGDKKAQGVANMTELLRTDKQLTEQLKNDILEHFA